jgi:hypothetical protein
MPHVPREARELSRQRTGRALSLIEVRRSLEPALSRNQSIRQEVRDDMVTARVSYSMARGSDPSLQYNS